VSGASARAVALGFLGVGDDRGILLDQAGRQLQLHAALPGITGAGLVKIPSSKSGRLGEWPGKIA
jgi:hypothetical protein